MKRTILTTLKGISLLLFVAALIFGCNLEPNMVNDTASNDDGPEANATQKLVNYLGEMGFETEGNFIEDGQIVVEGDIGFNIDDLTEEMQSMSTEASRQFAHGYLVRQSKIMNIRIRTRFNVPFSWSSAVNTAISAWNSISYCKIRFIRVASNASADLTISYNRTNRNYVAMASFPNANGNPGPTININPKYNYLSLSQKRWVMVHEIGHCIGMRHINNNESGRIYIPGTPFRDANSVMHPYVRTWRGFTAGDRNAARYLYPTSGPYVVVYQHANYRGKRWIIRSRRNESNANRFLLNDAISSIRCYNGAKVTIYQHANYGGAAMTILNSISNLATYDFNDITSSVRWYAPTGPFVILYRHANYRGRAYTVTGNISNLSSSGMNDQTSSVRVFNNSRVRLYQHAGYSGKSLYITSNKPNLVSYNFNDITSSVRKYY